MTHRITSFHNIQWALLPLLLALCCLTSPPIQAQQETPPTVQTYETWLREALLAARRSDRAGLEEAAERLITTSEVQTADGATIDVDNGWLETAIDTTEPNFDQIASRLGALVDAAARTDSSAPADAQERLNTILDNPPFAEPEPQEASLLTRFLDWLFDLLDQLFSPAAEAGAASSNLITWAVAFVCGLLLAGVLLYMLLNMRRAVTREASARITDDIDDNITANEALQQASAVAGSGDYRTAVRYLYLSSLLWLDERNLLRYDRALTNYEYLGHLANNPELHARLVPIVATFDRVWYGHTRLDEEDFRIYQQQVEELRKSA